MSPPTILTEIKKAKSRIFRRLYVKRRLTSTGLFETDWQDITKDVKSWGKISKSIDYVRYSQVRFNDVNVTVANDYGLYNPEDDEGSFWFCYASQQRTLVKIESGFIHHTLGSSGVWTNTEFPTNSSVFFGIIQGDLALSEENTLNFTIKPLLQVFRDFATRNLTGLSATGMTAKTFINLLRDQTDGSANFIFRPFFQDTTTFWVATETGISYVDITNTITSARPVPGWQTTPPQNDFYQMNVWEAVQKLAEAENLVPYITRDGIFKFSHRNPNTTTAAFHFFGRGFFDYDYGNTIKKISKYTRKISDYYSRVEVKWLDSGTTTAIVSTETAMQVTGTNDAWLLGHRTYRLENFWIGTLTSAQSLAGAIFEEVSSIKNEIDFTTTFVPHLELLDRVQVSYESTERALNSRWDVNDWAYDDSNTASDLYWASPVGDAIRFSAKEFKLVSIELNLDNLESRFVGIAL